MRLHTKLDHMGVAAAMERAKQAGRVSRDVMFMTFEPHKSRTHPQAFELHGQDERRLRPGAVTGEEEQVMAMTYREWRKVNPNGTGFQYQEYRTDLAEAARRANEPGSLNLGEKTAIVEATTVIAAALAHYRVSSAGVHCMRDWATVCQLGEKDTMLNLFKQVMDHEKGHRA